MGSKKSQKHIFCILRYFIDILYINNVAFGCSIEKAKKKLFGLLHFYIC
jgi:hypothetical protein